MYLKIATHLLYQLQVQGWGGVYLIYSQMTHNFGAFRVLVLCCMAYCTIPFSLPDCYIQEGPLSDEHIKYGAECPSYVWPP